LGRALDNIFIERFWLTIKYQHIYLNPADDGITLYQGISRWINTTINHIKELTGTSLLIYSKWPLDSTNKNINVVLTKRGTIYSN